jgi:hypothetical protein
MEDLKLGLHRFFFGKIRQTFGALALLGFLRSIASSKTTLQQDFRIILL